MSTWVSCLVILTVMVGSVFLLTEAWKRKGAWPKHFAQWMFYFIFLVGVMSTKPAPRYFEMVFVVILIGAAITLSRIDSQKFAKIAVVLFVVIGAVQWGENYILPALHHEGVDQSFRFLLFHDASSDSLSKQDLVDELGRRGCRPDQVVTSDPRLGEALKFLAIGDWKIDPENKCPAQQIKVERAATGAAGERFEEFVMQ